MTDDPVCHESAVASAGNAEAVRIQIRVFFQYIIGEIHDIVEIDAGDTYAYDEAGLATQQERERLAADRIFGLLPDDQRDELRALFEEFEALQSPEARFAKTMDNFQPLLLNDVNDGGDWRTHRVCRTQIMKRHQKTRLGSNEIADYAEMLIDVNVEKGNIRNE